MKRFFYFCLVGIVFLGNVLVLVISPDNLGFGNYFLSIFGLIMAFLGIFLWLWGYKSLGSSFALLAKASKLVTTGAYKYFKHPIYIGITLTFFGLSIAKGTLLGIIFTLLLTTPLNYIRAKREEKILKVIIILIFFLIFSKPVYAIVDPLAFPNNKFGIHILFPGELPNAVSLVNSSGGDWGYVTIPIQSDDKDLVKWQDFMDEAKKLHVIPIIRLATYPKGNYWLKPTLYDSVDFANFLNSLSWSTKNRYVILFNEPNKAQEWGNEVDPVGYAHFASDSIDIFKERNSDFFLLNGGLDMAAPDSGSSMDALNYLEKMGYAVPGIFNKFDGWDSHAYPNPDFSSSPDNLSRMGIRSFEHELSLLKNVFSASDKKIFITETGWNQNTLSADKIISYYKTAYSDIWNNNNIVAITPFLLSAGAGDFSKFSWMDNGSTPNELFRQVQQIKKIAGKPDRAMEIAGVQYAKDDDRSNWSAQKTNIWSRITINLFKKAIAWLIH